MDLQSVFSAFWLRQNSRSERPSWSLDCVDSNAQYTTACTAGYSGSIFYVSKEWEIQIHSQSDDCFERFTVDETQSHFLPMSSEWTEQWTDAVHLFTVNCLDRVVLPTLSPSSSNSGADALSGTATETMTDGTWMAIAVVLMAVICALIAFAAWYWIKWRKPVVVYEPRASKSAQDLELQQLPQPAFVDEDIAQIAPDRAEDEEKVDTPEHDGMVSGTGNVVAAEDPERNPNLKQIQSQQSMRSLGRGVSLMDGMYRSTSTLTIGDGLENETGNGGDEMEENQTEGDDMKMDITNDDGDAALNMIAGKSSISMVHGVGDKSESESELLYGDVHRQTIEGGGDAEAGDGDEDGDEFESMMFDESGGVYSV